MYRSIVQYLALSAAACFSASTEKGFMTSTNRSPGGPGAFSASPSCGGRDEKRKKAGKDTVKDTGKGAGAGAGKGTDRQRRSEQEEMMYCY